MNQDNTFIIAKEAWKLLGILVGLFLFFALIEADFLQAVTFIMAAGVAWIYRNPERSIPSPQPNSILAPGDGKVISIDAIDESENSFLLITIRSGCMDSSILRVPFESRLTKMMLQRGARLSSANPLSKLLNENAVLEFTDGSNNKMIVEHVLERSFAPLAIGLNEDREALQGSRYGVMLNGTLLIYLPKESRIALNVGDRVFAGQTLIGYFS